jgi:hypothetical protein
MPTHRLRLNLASERQALAIGAGCMLVASCLAVWHGLMPFQGLVESSARLDSWPEGVHLAPRQAQLYYRLTLALGFGVAGLTTLLAVAWSHLNRLTQARIWRTTVTMACTSALCLYLFKMTGDGPWAPVDLLMSNPRAVPIFGHRLLFVWMADALHAAVPALSPLRCFYASQVLVSFLALYAIGRWLALHVGNALSSLGQILAVILISSCLTYRNFYDIGVVFFFSCGFLALYRRSYVWFVVVVIVATFNHENALLLIPTAAFLLFDTEPRRVWLKVVGTSLVGHLFARALLQRMVPFQTQARLTLWTNFTRFFMLPRGLAFFLLALGGWYLLGLMSLPACDTRLRRLLVLFPMLFGVDFLVGQTNEPRMFNAFIPVLVAIILVAVQQMADMEKSAGLQTPTVNQGPSLRAD